MFGQEIFQKIIEAWESDQNHQRLAWKQKPIPDVRDFQALLETAFLASLEQEEGRSIVFNIGLLPENLVQQEQRSTGLLQIVLPFKERLPLTVESITRIASAFDPKTSSLIAEPVDPEKNNYQIWGAMVFSRKSNSFNEIPGLLDLSISRPDIMMVGAISAGSLVITRGDSQIGRFVNGDFISATPDPFYSEAMGKYIQTSINGNDGFKTYDAQYWLVYRDILDVLLAEAAARGHGGTIAIIPEQGGEQARELFSTTYSLVDNLELESIINRMISQSSSHMLDLALRKHCLERIDALAQLSCIDGALLLSNRLKVVSFGSILRAPLWKGEIIIGPDGFGGGGGGFDISKLGTRHKSAVNFVGACPGSYGFVISQDGPIRGFVRKDHHTILCWPDCNVSMFVK